MPAPSWPLLRARDSAEQWTALCVAVVVLIHIEGSAMSETSPRKLISADKVEGTPVYSTDGEKLGTINDVMIDKVSGKVVYADMSFGGFLGIGDKHHPLPWSMLKYDTGKGGYVVNLDKKRLEGAPAYGHDEKFDWEDENWARRVHDYWGVPPYWA